MLNKVKEKFKDGEAKKFIYFGIIGTIGTLVNTGILYLLTTYVELYYVFASVLATETAIVSNFVGNHYFTFRKNKDPSSVWKKFGKFQVISLITIIGTAFLLWIFTENFGIRYLIIWNFIAILIMFIFNFFLNRKFTWKKVNMDKAPKIVLISSLILVFFMGGVFAESYIATSGFGYHPEGHKQAIFYFEDAGLNVNLVDNSGNVIETYTTEKARDYDDEYNLDDMNGEIVECQRGNTCSIINFSDFTGEGEYYFDYNGKESENFEISNNIYASHLDTFLEFYEATEQQDSDYHANMNSFSSEIGFPYMADGSFILVAWQASETSIHLGRAYRRNPGIFEGPQFPNYVKKYIDYLSNLQGLDIQENTNGEGFRLKRDVPINNVFIPGRVEDSPYVNENNEIGIYDSGNNLIGNYTPTSLCGDIENETEYQECVDYAAEYYKCQEDEPCLNLSYTAETGIVAGRREGEFGVAEGWEYDWHCDQDVSISQEDFISNENPCLLFNQSESAENTHKTLTAFLETFPIIYDYYPEENGTYFERINDTYNYIEQNYPANSETMAYWGVSNFLMYDYTNETIYLQRAYDLRNDIELDLKNELHKGNDLYWEEYILHKDDIQNVLNENYFLNYEGKENPDEYFSSKVKYDYKDLGGLSISKNAERIYERARNDGHQDSKQKMFEAIFATKGLEYGSENEYFMDDVAENQLAWLTGMNAVQLGTGTNLHADNSQNFIFGITDSNKGIRNEPTQFHSRYLVETGYRSSSNGEILGARGNDFKFYDGSQFHEMDGRSEILGYVFGSQGNGFNGEQRAPDFVPGQSFDNGISYIPGWINGAYDMTYDEEVDVFYNYDDHATSWHFTEGESVSTALAIELISYLDAYHNNKARHERVLIDGTVIDDPIEPPIEDNNGTLVVDSSPQNASITINGTDYGLTPNEGIELVEGSYEIVLSLDGYETNTSTIDVVVNETYTHNVTLTEIEEPEEPIIENVFNETSISLDEPAEGNYFMYETDEVQFDVTLNGNASLDWYINGEKYATTEKSLEHNLAWNPGILYSGDKIREANVTVQYENQTREWIIDVRDFINPFFEPDEGRDGITTLKIHTYDLKQEFTNVNVTIANPSLVKTNYTLNGTKVENNETLWKKDFTFNEENTHHLVYIELSNNETNQSINFTLQPHQLGYYHIPEEPTPNPSPGPSPSGTSRPSESYDLVYVTLSRDILNENQTQEINLDIDGTRNVKNVEARFLGPSGFYTIALNLTDGTRSYGTWSETFGDLESGTHFLREIIVMGNSKTAKFSVSDRSFYVLGESVGEDEELGLVYTILSDSEVSNVTNVTFTLDARDYVGIDEVTFLTEVRRGEEILNNFTSDMELKSGNEKYGTWEGKFEISVPDSTYVVRSVTLKNSEKEKTHLILDRSVYATNKVNGGVIENEGFFNFITGFSVQNSLKDYRESPLFPLFISILLAILLTSVILIKRKLKK